MCTQWNLSKADTIGTIKECPLYGAPDGGVRIPNPARKLRHIPHPAELFGPIPHPAGCLLFVLFLPRNNISEMPYSIVIRMSQIYGRLP